jgi:hypothetical protein
MEKKGLLVLVLMAIVVTGTYAVDFKISLGGGGYITNCFDGGVLGEKGDVSMSTDNRYTGGGGLILFDATFVELSFGFFGGKGSLDIDNGITSTDSSYSLIGVDIGLMGKYPFAIGSKFLLYPLLGINYRIIAAMSDEDGNKIDDAKDHSALYFRLGLGADIFFLPDSVTKNLYLRLGLTGGIRLPDKSEKNMADYYKSLGLDAKAYPGIGIDFKLAVGYRF